MAESLHANFKPLPFLLFAVDSNDIYKAERWLKSWARVLTKRGDRRLVDVAKDLNRKEIIRLLEEYEHINEFACATFACDKTAMMNLIALGVGKWGWPRNYGFDFRRERRKGELKGCVCVCGLGR